MNVNTLLSLVDSIAPFRYAESWDNVGLQTGHPNNEVGRVLVALEVTPPVIQEALELRANVIIAHHPLIFAPIRNLAETNPVTRMTAMLVRANINLIVAHTNLDAVAQGTNGEIADRLDLRERVFLKPTFWEGDTAIAGMGLIGALPDALPLHEFAARCMKAFGSATIGIVGDDSREIRRVAICSGSGGDALRALNDEAADVLVTGEMNHHQCAEARDRGFAAILAGHHESEVIVGPRLAQLILREAGIQKLALDVIVSTRESAPLRRQ